MMRSIHEVSELTGVSIRTLQYYDGIGLLPPAARSDAGYRLYDEDSLSRLQQILLFRELQFSLKEIRAILDNPAFDPSDAIEKQIQMLTMKKEHLENLILFARGIKLLGVDYMDYTAFDTSKLDAYAAQARSAWEQTPAYQEYLEKSKSRTPQMDAVLGQQIMEIFSSFGHHLGEDPASPPVQELVQSLRDFFNAHFYTCTDELLLALGKMYSRGGDFTRSIDSHAGTGTAEFVNEAIRVFCKR